VVEFSYALHILSISRNRIHVEILRPGFQTSDNFLQGPGGVWCDVDMMEILYFSALDQVLKNSTIQRLWMTRVQVIRALVQDLRCFFALLFNRSYGMTYLV